MQKVKRKHKKSFNWVDSDPELNQINKQDIIICMPHIQEIKKKHLFKANLVLFCSEVSHTVQKPSSGKYDVMQM